MEMISMFGLIYDQSRMLFLNLSAKNNTERSKKHSQLKILMTRTTMQGSSSIKTSAGRNYVAALAQVSATQLVAQASSEAVANFIARAKRKAAANRLLDGWTSDEKSAFSNVSPACVQAVLPDLRRRSQESTGTLSRAEEQILLAAQSEEGLQALIFACKDAVAAHEPFPLEPPSQTQPAPDPAFGPTSPLPAPLSLIAASSLGESKSDDALQAVDRSNMVQSMSKLQPADIYAPQHLLDELNVALASLSQKQLTDPASYATTGRGPRTQVFMKMRAILKYLLHRYLAPMWLPPRPGCFEQVRGFCFDYIRTLCPHAKYETATLNKFLRRDMYAHYPREVPCGLGKHNKKKTERRNSKHIGSSPSVARKEECKDSGASPPHDNTTEGLDPTMDLLADLLEPTESSMSRTSSNQSSSSRSSTTESSLDWLLEPKPSSLARLFTPESESESVSRSDSSASSSSRGLLEALDAAALDVLDPDDDVPLTLINKQKTNKSATCQWHVPVEPIGEAGGKTLYRLSDQFEQLPEEDLESEVRHYNLSNAPFSSCYLLNP